MNTGILLVINSQMLQNTSLGLRHGSFSSVIYIPSILFSLHVTAAQIAQHFLIQNSSATPTLGKGSRYVCQQWS